MIFLAAFSSSVSAKIFTDTEDHWAQYSIDYVTNEGYFVGTSDNLFSPDSTMTRGMFVAVLSRISGEDVNQHKNNVFSDVKSSDYFASAVAWAYSNKIVAGLSSTTFAPNLPVTREQICLMLQNYLDYAGISLTEKNAVSKYKDDAKISSWSYASVYAMQKSGYLVGSDGIFRPQDNATRAECASVFARVCGNFYGNFVTEDEDKEDKADKADNEDNENIVVPDDDIVSVDKGTLVGVFTSTFYCPCSECNGSYAGMTSSGAPMVVGETIAVDPRVIPLGSSVYIEFSRADLQHLNGVYKAADTGSKINDLRVDVLVETCDLAATYGVDNAVKIYLLN